MKKTLAKISIIFSIILVLSVPVFAQTTITLPEKNGQVPITEINSTNDKQAEPRSVENFYFGNKENVTPNYICARADLSSADCWDMYRKWEARDKSKGYGLYIEAKYPSIFSLYRTVQFWSYFQGYSKTSKTL